jgi:3-hydroxybutyryl-CoA dehydratase
VTVSPATLVPGAELAPLAREVSQADINRYADASGDHNPLHIDPDFAATTQFGGPIMHGMMLLAFLSEMLTASFGENWVRSGRLKARFRGAGRPGDTVTCRGAIVSVDGGLAKVRVECVNQETEVLVTADVEVQVA